MRSRAARKAVCAMRNRCSISSSHFAEKKSARMMCSTCSDSRANRPLSILPGEFSGARRPMLSTSSISKAKPDALSEDVDPEAQKSLAAHAELITNDRLLELIDQFAAAEGRMKWAPNKKLHFEVAIIKAIQSLRQATLDEVIENL